MSIIILSSLSISKQRLLSRLGHSFANNSELAELALTHRSCGAYNNERLEFLGDSLLGYIITDDLYHRFPEAKEGQLSRLRSQLVKGETLAKIAREFGVGECLNLGEGEMKSGGHRRDSILADVVEAFIGAIYLDAGMDVCQTIVLSWFAERLQACSLESLGKDPKTQLQELMQALKLPLPVYEVVKQEGEDHAQQFTVACRVKSLAEPTVAQASSRRVAEKQAAAAALQQLEP